MRPRPHSLTDVLLTPCAVTPGGAAAWAGRAAAVLGAPMLALPLGVTEDGQARLQPKTKFISRLGLC